MQNPRAATIKLIPADASLFEAAPPVTWAKVGIELLDDAVVGTSLFELSDATTVLVASVVGLSGTDAELVVL
jgi:hypothetical protein